MEDVKNIVKSVLLDLQKAGREVRFEKAQEALSRAVGPKAAAYAKIVYLTKDRIRVNVNNSSVLYDLNLKKATIKRKIKKALGIDDIRFRLGDIT